ncbi:MAG: GNAT family N-acetyltransferase [Bacteroidota bacterium]
MIRIEKAEKKHAEIITDLGVTSFYETYAAYNTASDMLQYTNENYNKERLEEEIDNPEVNYFIAYLDDQPAGFAKLRQPEETHEMLQHTRNIELERIYVLQSFKRSGIGKALIDTCIERSRKENFEVIWLGVWQQNQKAIKFYEKIGFEYFGDHSFLLGEDLQHDLLMKMKL